jgi:hypothetical protein
LKEFGDPSSTCSTSSGTSSTQTSTLSEEEEKFIKTLNLTVDAGLVEREILTAEMAVIKASVEKFDDDLLEKLEFGEEVVCQTTAEGKRITIRPARDKTQIYLWKLVEKIFAEEAKKAPLVIHCHTSNLAENFFSICATTYERGKSRNHTSGGSFHFSRKGMGVLHKNKGPNWPLIALKKIGVKAGSTCERVYESVLKAHMQSKTYAADPINKLRRRKNKLLSRGCSSTDEVSHMHIRLFLNMWVVKTTIFCRCLASLQPLHEPSISCQC